MTPIRRPAATAGRLLAHGLGLGLLAGGVVLGAQGAAQALVFILQEEDGSPLKIRFDSGDLDNFSPPTATVTGSFFLDVNTNNVTVVDPIQLTFDAPGAPLVWDFSWAAGTGGFLSDGLDTPGGPFGTISIGDDLQGTTCNNQNDAPCIRFQFSVDPRNVSGGDFVRLETGFGGEVNLGSIPNDGIFGNTNGDFGCNNTSGGVCEGGALAVPGPLSVFSLLPIGALVGIRRRYRKFLK